MRFSVFVAQPVNMMTKAHAINFQIFIKVYSPLRISGEEQVYIIPLFNSRADQVTSPEKWWSWSSQSSLSWCFLLILKSPSDNVISESGNYKESVGFYFSAQAMG
jgi:hypothetical protein